MVADIMAFVALAVEVRKLILAVAELVQKAEYDEAMRVLEERTREMAAGKAAHKASKLAGSKK